jgi:sugar lactone lactonase YvrE
MARIPSTEARVLVAPDADTDRYLLEGPREVAVGGRDALAWVNIQTATDATSGAVHLRFWDTGERRSLPQPSRPGFLLPTDRPGVMFVGREKELGTLDLRSGEWTHYGTIPDVNPRTIINDGEGVTGGRAVVFGTKDARFANPIAHLYLFTLDDRRVWTLADGQLCSNGKVFARDADGLLLYDIDTPRRVVTRYRFDLDRHTVRDEGVAVDLHSVAGLPDGMVDAGDQTVIIAIYNPDPATTGRAYRFHLGTGEMLEEWITPGSPRVTCPLLVERDGGVKLVLTSAVEGMPDDQRRQCTNAGEIFIADTTLARVPRPELMRLTD